MLSTALIVICHVYESVSDLRSKEAWLGEFRDEIAKLGQTLVEAQTAFGGATPAAGPAGRKYRWLERIARQVQLAKDEVDKLAAQGLLCDLFCRGKGDLVNIRDVIQVRGKEL